MELHYKDGVITIRGVPNGYRYLLAIGAKANPIPKIRQLALAVSDGSELQFTLSAGPFVFRARHKTQPHYEFVGSTDILPVVLQTGMYAPPYEQIEADPKLAGPDERTHIMERQ